MNFLTRRGFLYSALPVWSSTSALNGAFAALLSEPARAEEPFGGDAQVIGDWMQKWMGASRTSVGLLHLTRFADPVYVTTKPIEWHPSNPGDEKYPSVIVPEMFVTDLASVPRVFWSALKPDGQYAYAAVVHDYLYWTQTQSRENSDEILRIIMEEFAVLKIAIYAIYGSVRLFGQRAWDKNIQLRNKGERRILKDLPTSPTVTWEEYKKTPGVFAPQ